MIGVGSNVTVSHSVASSLVARVASANLPSSPARKAADSRSDTVKSPLDAERETSGVLERETRPLGEMSETVKTAFFAG